MKKIYISDYTLRKGTGGETPLSFKEKMQEIKNIITSENVRESLKFAKPNSLIMKIMLIPIKLKFTFLTYLEGAFISKVKSGNVKLFAKLKANR